MSGRGEHYAFPQNTPQQLADIGKMRSWLRQYGLSREAQPNDSTLIPLSGDSENEVDWKPFYLETFGTYMGHPFKIADIKALAHDARVYNRLIKIAQYHGAAHSLAMALQLIKEKIPFDFLMHNDVPNEMPDELEYVKYTALYALKLPLVITRLQNTAEEYLYKKALLMSDRARWCTNEWKIRPFKKFLRFFFFNKEELDKVPDAKYVDILQLLGMQAFQSPGRRGLNPFPTPSNISVPRAQFWENQPEGKRILRVFDALPVHALSHEDDLALIADAGINRNPSELEMGRHGCLLCPYASIPYYLQLKENYPTLFETCKRRVREGNRKPGTNFTFIDPARITATYRKAPYNLTAPPL
jgi:3'-phosphoadenosine 5'-phosphosulfate sulfotransferase (PAPS reductase)/FAD synthetase